MHLIHCDGEEGSVYANKSNERLKQKLLGDLVATCHKCSSLSRFLLCEGEHRRHRLSAICIPETHEANLHKFPTIVPALRAVHGSA